jgi:hypothetical protein
LSTDKLTATSNPTTPLQSVISDIGILPGETGYFELTVVSIGSLGPAIMGMGTYIPTSSPTETQQVGLKAKSFAYRGNGGTYSPYQVNSCILKTLLTGSGSTTYVGVNTCSISIASPCVVTVPNHNYYEGMAFKFRTSNSLPYPIGTSTTYYVRLINSNSFNISTTPTGSLVNTAGAPGAGTITVNPLGTCTDKVVATDVFSFAINNATGKCNIYRNGVLDPTGLGLNAGVFINFYVATGDTWYACTSGDGTACSVTANFGQNAWDARTDSVRTYLETAGYKIGIYN